MWLSETNCEGSFLFNFWCFSSYADAPTEYEFYTCSRPINVKFSLLHRFNNIDSKQNKWVLRCGFILELP